MINLKDLQNILADVQYSSVFWCAALNYNAEEAKKYKRPKDYVTDYLAKYIMAGGTVIFQTIEDGDYKFTKTNLDNISEKDMVDWKQDLVDSDYIIQKALFNEYVYA